jgi:hypothetical protein
MEDLAFDDISVKDLNLAKAPSRRKLSKTYRMSPTAERFHNSTRFVRGLMGPFGSGKSTMCCWEIMLKACAQDADQNGIRRTKWAIVRNSYPDLKSTTIQTWKDWFGDLGEIVYGSPIEFRAVFDIGDGTKVDMLVYFLALNIEKDMRKLLSLEVTGAWINEAREVSQTALINLRGRVGRYPATGQDQPGATWHGIIMDTNPPDDDHWWYSLAEKERPLSHEFFKQPGGYREAGTDGRKPAKPERRVSVLLQPDGRGLEGLDSRSCVRTVRGNPARPAGLSGVQR